MAFYRDFFQKSNENNNTFGAIRQSLDSFLCIRIRLHEQMDIKNKKNSRQFECITGNTMPFAHPIRTQQEEMAF